MNHAEGSFVGENAVDAVAVAQERSPGCHLLAVQTTLVLREQDGTVRILNVAKERSRPPGDEPITEGTTR
jgi:hypothetical protein